MGRKAEGQKGGMAEEAEEVKEAKEAKEARRTFVIGYLSSGDDFAQMLHFD